MQEWCHHIHAGYYILCNSIPVHCTVSGKLITDCTANIFTTSYMYYLELVRTPLLDLWHRGEVELLIQHKAKSSAVSGDETSTLAP